MVSTPGENRHKFCLFPNMPCTRIMHRVVVVTFVIVLCEILLVIGQTTSINETPPQEIVTNEVPQPASQLPKGTPSPPVYIPVITTIRSPSSTQAKKDTPPRIPPDLVTDQAPVINRPPSNMTVAIGRKITLLCRVSGNPSPKISWEKDGHLIPPNSLHYMIKANNNLRINSASLEDAGVYRCIASSRVGRTVSTPATIVVEMPVRISVGPGNYNVKYGTELNLTCTVEGFPKPEIVWLKRNQPIKGSEDKSVLTINATMSATYTCMASNDPLQFGRRVDQKTGKIIVKGRPNWCASYNGLVCRSVLGSSRVFYNASLQNPVGNLEQTVQNLLTQSENSVSKECYAALKTLICHQAYPDCDEETKGAPVPKMLAMEDCQVVQDNLCRHDIFKLRNTQNQRIEWGAGQGNLNLPDCDALPSKTSKTAKYTDVNLFPEIDKKQVTTNCILGTGQYYMGTLNTTREGLPCQPWQSQKPHVHVFYPEVYPVLQNASNYCRNPGESSDKPWCFTSNVDRSWQNCDIPNCDELTPTSTGSPQGVGPTTSVIGKMHSNSSANTMLLVIIFSVAGGIAAILVVVIYAYRHYKYRKRFANYKYPVFDPNRLQENPLFGKDVNRSYNPRLECLEYPRNDITYIRDVGEGAFGRVFQANTPHLIREEEKTVVAIKMLKKDAERDVCDYFNREAEIISRFDHPNIIRLLGICFVGKPLCLILEFMAHGDLQEFLQSHHPYSSQKKSRNNLPKFVIDTKVQLRMAKQIAYGMVYLTDKRFVHRDLATRNCLVNSNLDVKISDFGLAQNLGESDQYIGNKDETIPIRWTAPEALWQYHFTTFSDVWSFGVLLWEIFSFAQQPYAAMSHEQVFLQTHQGHTLSCPTNTPLSAYHLMQKCWTLDHTQRPTFHTVMDTLSEISSDMAEESSASSPDTSVSSIDESS